MACDVPPRECLELHIRSKLAGASVIRLDESTQEPDGRKRWYLTAQCPNHDDAKASLKVSTGLHKRIVWICYAGCSDSAVRHAIIGREVQAGCLPRNAAELRDLEEAMTAVLTSDLSHADARLHALALLRSPGGKLPAGGDLVDLGAAVHVSRSGAFAARDRRASGTTK